MALVLPFALMLGGSSPEPSLPPPADIRLQWRAPDDCPDAAAIEARVAQLTEGRPDGVGTLDVSGMVTADEGRYHLTLTTSHRGRTGVRELSSAYCNELAETVALVVAVSMEPALATEHEVPPSRPEPATELVPEPTGEAPPDISEGSADLRSEPPVEAVRDDSVLPASRAERRPRIPSPQPLVRAGLGPELGALPGVTAAVRVAVGIGWPRARVMLEATYLTPRRAEGPGGSAGLYQQGTASLLGCGRLATGPWSFPLCGGLEAGGLRVDGRGLQTPRSRVGPWLGPLARAGVVRSFGRAGLWLDLEGVARGVATRVVVNETLAFRPAIGSLRLLAGFEYSWR